MGYSSLFIISTLAVLGAATAEVCTVDELGLEAGFPVTAADGYIYKGGVANIPNVCGYNEVGVQVEVCVPRFVPASVQLLSFTKVDVRSSIYPVRIKAIAFCNLESPNIPSVPRGYGYGLGAEAVPEELDPARRRAPLVPSTIEN